MARKSSNRKINDSEYEVGRKYSLVEILNQRIFPKLDGTRGLIRSELLDGNDMEIMLNAYLDEQNTWTLNLNSTFYAIGIPEEVFAIYVTPSDMQWTTISNNIYGTTRLAWLLMKLNNVKDANIFNPIRAGTAIKYLDKSKYVDKIIEVIGNRE